MGYMKQNTPANREAGGGVSRRKGRVEQYRWHRLFYTKGKRLPSASFLSLRLDFTRKGVTGVYL